MEPKPLLFKTKSLGDEPHSFCLNDEKGQLESYNIKWNNMNLCSAEKGDHFTLENKESVLVIRLEKDKLFALEVSHRKYSEGSKILVAGFIGMKNMECKFCLNEDFTLSPFENRSVVIGVKDKEIQLVNYDDDEHKSIFEIDEKFINKESLALRKLDELHLQDNLLNYKEQVKTACNEKMLHDLKKNGFVRLANYLDKDLVAKARKIINKHLGMIKDTEQFKGKTGFPELSRALNIQSSLPDLAQFLLGRKERRDLDYGQVCLRFPGDLVDMNLESVTKYYAHIDGLASDFIKGVTDHYGTIKNFDLLIGVLLTDLTETNSGEFSVYPSSHMKISEYLKENGMDELKNKGSAAFVKNFGDWLGKDYVNCLGKAGDVFVANFLTAHFFMPNDASEIRYAVYFRIKCDEFEDSKEVYCEESMLDPWVHWPVMKDIQID